MKPDRYQQICEIFVTARSKPPTERSAYLNEACGGDANLRNEVESLLANDDAATNFLDNPVLGDDFLNHVPPSGSQSANAVAERQGAQPPLSGHHASQPAAAGPRNLSNERHRQPSPPAAIRGRSKHRISVLLTIICLALAVVTMLAVRQARQLARNQVEARIAAAEAEQQRAATEKSAANIALDAAAVAIRANNVAAARRYLDAVPESLRNKTWTELLAQADESIAVLAQHDGEVMCVAYSPDGSLLASAAKDGTIRLWDVETHRLRRTLLVQGTVFCGLAFAPTGESLIAGTDAGMLHVWNVEDGAPLASWQAHGSAVRCVCYRPDGRMFASAGDDSTIRLWDPASNSEVLRIAVPAAVASVAYSPNGERIAGGCGDGIVRVWQISGGDATQLHQFRANRSGPANGLAPVVAYSPDGTVLATGTATGMITLWHLSEERGEPTWVAHCDAVQCVMFTPDGKRLVSGSRDTTLRLWDANSGRQTATLRGHTKGITSIACSPDRNQLATASSDTTIRIWRLETGEKQKANESEE